MTASPKRDRGYTLQSINDLFLRTEFLIEVTRKNPEIQKALKITCNYTVADLNALVVLLARTRKLFDWSDLSDIREDLGKPQDPTPQQRVALGELGRDLGKFRKLARRALAEHPALLELLG